MIWTISLCVDSLKLNLAMEVARDVFSRWNSDTSPRRALDVTSLPFQPRKKRYSMPLFSAHTASTTMYCKAYWVLL